MSSEVSSCLEVTGCAVDDPAADCAAEPAPRTNSTRSPRFACLDALRSWMMLLGIVLHTANAHAVGCPHWWPVMDRYRHGIFDSLSFATHSFRMEIFFLLSGFFGRLLLRRYGLRGFVTNRGRRVLQPLAIGVVLMAITQSGAVWVFTPPSAPPVSFPAYVCTPWPSEVVGTRLWHPWFCHLWFLEYLALFYVGIVFFDLLLQGRCTGWMEIVERKLIWLMRQSWMPFAAALVTCLALLPMRSWVVDTPLSLVPESRFFAYYGLFVSVGWMTHRNPALLTATALQWNWRNSLLLVACVGTLLAMLWSAGTAPAFATWGTTLAIRYVSALCTWLALLQILGMVVVLLNNPNPILRYLADASYWCYLVHLPIVLWLQSELPASVSGFARFALVLGIAATVSLGTYHVFVRYTPLNEVFGSRRPGKVPVASGSECRPNA